MTTYPPITLPDFRNLGVMLRVVLLAVALRLISACILAPDLAGAYVQYISQGMVFELALLSSLAALYVLAPWFRRVSSYGLGVVFVLSLVVLIVVALQWGLRALLPEQKPESLLRDALLAVAVCSAILFYLNWRHLRLSPSLAESRLMALQERIRPHFLFNTLNSILGLIREEPKRAENMLENLADLFRALMSEPQTLVPFSRELELAKAYTEIEAIRLGSRLRVNWRCDTAPVDALVPLLFLQPLVENAVLHGVVPLEEGAEVSVEAYEDDGSLVVFVRNPNPVGSSPREGNGMALANIKERLELHFDAEARLRAYTENNDYVVSVRLPIQYE